jgi:hypothetical protein
MTWVRLSAGKGIFLFVAKSRPGFGFTPVSCFGVERQEHETAHWTPSGPEVKIDGALTPLILTSLHNLTYYCYYYYYYYY